MNDLEMAAKFREAGRYIAEHGLHKGDAGYNGGPRCIQGALESVLGLTSGFDMTAMPLMLVAAERLGSPMVNTVHRWNDAHTRDEVVAFCLDLAHDLELRHQIATSPLPAESRHDAIIPSLEAVPV